MVAERIATLIITDTMPRYWFTCKTLLLSKTKSPVAQSIKDIRPIGILPALWKWVEKALLHMVKEHCPSLIETGLEQSGFKQGRSTQENLVLMMKRMCDPQINSRIFMFVDL